ncbi:MAG: murein biosynthesis integral membrane protein MurJ [Nitratireductor sp.]|nr:murein biosynthesis integral membrane protein MurJ [Nitratireductor sp.]
MAGLVGKFFSVGSATMASRVLGFVREALIAGFLGAGPVADAFYAAFRFPNLFRRLFAEGAFNTAFVPLFAKELEAKGTDGARRFAEEVLAALLVVLLLISAVAMLFMPVLVGTIIAPKFADDPAKFALTVELTRIMFPFLTAMSLVAMFSGILNSFRRYFLAALAPVIMNVVFIVVLTGAWYLGASDRTLGISMAWGVFLSGLLQVSMLVYGILKEGFPLSLRRPSISRPVRRLVTLAIPTAIAAGITQVNLLVGQIIASGQDGAIAIMNYADRLMQLPLGVIAISIGVVLLPELTRALAAGDTGEATKLQNRSIEFGLGLTLPAAVGLFTIPVPLIALLYERGAFTRDLTEITASVLAWFAVGLPAFVLIKIFQPAYYAREDMKTPMWFSGANAIVNVTLALLLFPVYGVAGLAIATSAAGWLNVVLLGGALWRQGLLQLDAATIRNSGIIVATSLLVGLVLWAGQGIFSEMLLHDALGIRIFSVLALILVAMLVYFAITIGTGAIPGQQLLRLLRRPRKNSAT